ncbi:MAG: nucleotide exchange factor GrpE [Anaerolineae bacterium]
MTASPEKESEALRQGGVVPEEAKEGAVGSEEPGAVEGVAEVAPEAAEEAPSPEQLRAELEEATRQREEYLDQWRRTAAEFSNFRKRIEKERAEFTRQANARLIGRLLGVLDDFERAFATVPASLLRLTWIEGLALIHRKLQVILEGEGLEVIETEGKDFDPVEHEAVTHEVVEGYREGQVIGEVQKGYRLGDRVLRPALVRVARAPEVVPEKASPPEGTPEAQAGGGETGPGEVAADNP